VGLPHYQQNKALNCCFTLPSCVRSASSGSFCPAQGAQRKDLGREGERAAAELLGVAGSSAGRGLAGGAGRESSPLWVAASRETANLTCILCNPPFPVAVVTAVLPLHSRGQPGCFQRTLQSPAGSSLPFWHP